MKVTIIGAGNMGGSAALGFAGCGAVAAPDITVTARHESSLEKFKSAGIRTCTDNRAAIKDADIVFYAVKPWQMEDVLKDFDAEYRQLRRKLMHIVMRQPKLMEPIIKGLTKARNYVRKVFASYNI